MANVFFTWLGPPQASNKVVNGLHGLQRPDLFGLLRCAAANIIGPAAAFKLCVLKKFKLAFEAEVPNNVEVIAIEDSFPTGNMLSILLSRPDVTNLGLTVDYILRETLNVRGTQYNNTALPYRQLAFCKDLWSLYCIYAFGGYHVDCGCFPDARAAGDLRFPEPTTFGVAAITDTLAHSPYWHAKVRFQSGTVCGSISGGPAGPLRGLVLNGLTTEKGGGQSPLKKQIDVWLLRGPAGHNAAKLALQFYVRGWFAIRDQWPNHNNLGDAAAQLRSQALRELAVSSCATGVSHAGNSGCGSKEHWKKYMIQTGGIGDPYVASIGIRKVGFQSHV